MHPSRRRARTGGFVHTSMSLTPGQLAQIDRLAEIRGLSRSAILGELIDDALRRAWAKDQAQPEAVAALS